MKEVRDLIAMFLTLVSLCSAAKCAGAASHAKDHMSAHEQACEEILRVEWIAESRGLGTFRHKFNSGDKQELRDFFVYWGVQGPNINYGGVRKDRSQLSELENPAKERVSFLDETSSHTFILSPAQINAIKHWNFLPFDRRDGGLEFRHGENSLVIPKHTFQNKSSLGKQMASICIRHPSKSINAIVEFRSAERYLTKDRLISAFSEIKKEIPNFELTISQFKKTPTMDLNADAIADFPELNIYSYLGKYYRLVPAWNSELDRNFGTYVFGGNRHSCFLNDLYPRFYVEEKKRFFINGSCDIATLTGD